VTLDPTSLVTFHRHAVETFGDRLSALDPDQLDAPTPCLGWNVRDLIAHVTVEDLWTPPLLEGRTIEQVGDAFDGDVLGDDPVAAFRSAAAGALSAVATVDLERIVHLSFGDVPARVYLEQLFADHLIHSWDLARAIGADERLPEELVDGCRGWFDDQEAAYRQAGAIGARPDITVSDPQGQLLLAFGRDPMPPDPARTLAAVRRLLAAFERRDVAAIVDAMTDDARFESTDPPDGSVVEGSDELRSYWERFFADSPQARFTVEELSAAGDRATARWRYDWVDGDGTVGHVRGVDLYVVRGSRVAEKRSYVKG
jgi:uncharacterized protein (TIGR03086 family)